MTKSITVAELKTNLASQHMKTLNNFFSNDEKKTLKFLSAVAYCAQSTPKLLECSQESIISSFMKCAEYNLFPSSVSGEAYILPYSNKGKMEAQFQIGYQGIITLLYRAGVSSIYTDIVRKNDEFGVYGGLEPRIEHKYALESRGEPIGVYVVATVNGEKIWKYMAKDEVLAFKKFSKSANGQYGDKYSPWNPDNDPELNMWRKTAIKQIAKILPKNEEIYKALDNDNADGDITEYTEKQMIEHATRPSEGKIADLLGTAVREKPQTENMAEAEITEVP